MTGKLWNLIYRDQFSGVQFQLRKRAGRIKMYIYNQSARPIEEQLETSVFVLYYLNRTYGFPF